MDAADFPPQDTLLSVEDEDSLADDRILISKSSGGRRKVSAALLTPPSSHAGSLSSISSAASSSATSLTASVRWAPLEAVNQAIILPNHAESVAAIEFSGFTLEVAQQIYARFLARPLIHNNPDDLLDYMKAQAYIQDGESPPRAAMSSMGLTHEVQNRILDDRFEQIRQTQSITAWVHNTITVNYETLLLLQQRFKAAAIYIRKKKKRKIRPAPKHLPAQSRTGAIRYSYRDILHRRYVSCTQPTGSPRENGIVTTARKARPLHAV